MLKWNDQLVSTEDGSLVSAMNQKLSSTGSTLLLDGRLKFGTGDHQVVWKCNTSVNNAPVDSQLRIVQATLVLDDQSVLLVKASLDNDEGRYQIVDAVISGGEGPANPYLYSDYDRQGQRAFSTEPRQYQGFFGRPTPIPVPKPLPLDAQPKPPAPKAQTQPAGVISSVSQGSSVVVPAPAFGFMAKPSAASATASSSGTLATGVLSGSTSAQSSAASALAKASATSVLKPPPSTGPPKAPVPKAIIKPTPSTASALTTSTSPALTLTTAAPVLSSTGASAILSTGSAGTVASSSILPSGSAGSLVSSTSAVTTTGSASASSSASASAPASSSTIAAAAAFDVNNLPYLPPNIGKPEAMLRVQVLDALRLYSTETDRNKKLIKRWLNRVHGKIVPAGNSDVQKYQDDLRIKIDNLK